VNSHRSSPGLRRKGVPFPWALLRFWVMRSLPTWLAVALPIHLFQIAICVILRDNDFVRALLLFSQSLPPFLQRVLSSAGLQGGDLVSLISVGYVHPLVLVLFMAYAVAVPTGLLVGELESGSMELILSRAVTRTQVFVCAAIPTVAGMFLLTQVMFLGTLAGAALAGFEEPLPLAGFYQLSLNGGLLAVTAATMALFVSAFSRERGTAVGLTLAYLVFDYLLNIVSTWWPPLAQLQPFSLFHYINSREVLTQPGWPVDDMVVLGVVALTALALGWIVWRRRDLPV
jgi:ABC-2 type transport system permease protein